MLHILWLAPALPLFSAIVLALFGPSLSRKFSRKIVSVLGAGSVGGSAIVALIVAYGFLRLPQAHPMFVQRLWTWMDTGIFRPEIAFYLDSVSLLMLLVVTFVGFFIHLYSTGYMRDDDGYPRFFAYMNLFVASMLILVLGNNLLLLYLGWEGVGLCSYLLIGFWY